MSEITKKIGDVLLINSYTLWESINGYALEHRARELLKNVECSFYDEDYKLLKKPVVGITGIWGMPLYRDATCSEEELMLWKWGKKLSLVQLRSYVEDMMAFGAFYSYLNPNDKNAADMNHMLQDHAHFSTAHTSSLNIIVAGASTCVENEFMCQRDILHFCRLTEARTKAQNEPVYSVLYPELLWMYKDIQNYIYQTKETIQPLITNKNMLEWANLAASSAKATLFMVTWSLKNYQKLLAYLNDDGKEEEYKRLLYLMNTSLHGLFPSLFLASAWYTYQPPKHR